MKDHDISKSSGHEEGVPEVFAPVVLGDLSRGDKAHVKGEPRVQLSLPVDERIGKQIRKVHFSSGLDNRRVLFDNEPTNVSVKKSAGSIVGVRLGFGEFVVDSVIAGPVVDGSLVGDGVGKHEHGSEQKVGLIRTVRPQPMNSDCYSKATVEEKERYQRKKKVSAYRLVLQSSQLEFRFSAFKTYLIGHNKKAHISVSAEHCVILATPTAAA